MTLIAIVVGFILIVSVLADILNTLLTTTSSTWRWWLTAILFRRSWAIVSTIGRRFPDDPRRERLYSLFVPVTILVMLVSWVAQQIVGFGLIWWGLRGVEGTASLFDSIYFSGAVFFTIGFGDLVPTGAVPRVGSLIEAFSGLLTIALVIGFLPQLYAAYSEREQKLLTLDDGSEDRITPISLILSRAPDGNPRELDTFFSEWEAWVAQVLETHTTHPMLSLFRSQHEGQSWITALGLITDTALHVELIEDGQKRAGYWAWRRSVRLLLHMTRSADLSEYRQRLDERYAVSEGSALAEFYDVLKDHGFPMLPRDEAVAHALEFRRTYDAALEYLIDVLHAPRGFQGHQIGHRDTHALNYQTADSSFIDGEGPPFPR